MSNGFTSVVACGAAGLLPLWLGLREALVVRRLRRDGIRTRGVVVDNVRSDSDGSIWVPVIAFRDQQGHRVKFTPRIRGSGLGLATGCNVPVVYLPRDPQSARVYTPRHMVGPVVFLLFVGAAFLGFAVLSALGN
ncbi:DUF3592 domain-containing protein [Streptomyces sp. NPDC050636]|uniref:DUF3592 domain-containing protein n=1 Tax=Streptomyces sp. NPDC050636 TaxID=3154510 RepID=UPI0034370ACC